MNNDIIEAQNILRNADAILIGASNGLSISEGYDIFANDEMFRSQFGDFQEKYGIRCVLDGCFSRVMPSFERRKFVEKLVKLWVESYSPSRTMVNLRALVGDKPYFILTTNADEHLEAAGFSADKVWEIEGTFRHLRDGIRPENRLVGLNDFLMEYGNKKLVILELGIAPHNRIIKSHLLQLTANKSNIAYITLNLPQEIYIPDEIADRSIAVSGDISVSLTQLLGHSI